MTLRIAVVGAGTAGAAAAILLARAGHDVEVLERVADPGPVGAGITLQPTGQAALARLGLLQAIVERGAPIDRLTCVRTRARPLVDLAYAEIDPRLVGLGIHRGVLFETLLGALRETTAKLACGVGVVRSDVDPRGRWLVDEGGARHGPYDLVIAADGSVCELHACAPRVSSKPYPWGALWIVAADPGFGAERKILQIVDGARVMLGFLPTGTPPGGGPPVVSLFWSIAADRVDAWRAAGLPAWRDRVLRLEPRAEPILDALPDLDAVLFSKYRDVAMKPWHADRIVFVGDAAHATSPQLGQGANLALIDAVALADELAAAATRAAQPADIVAHGVAAYSRNRLRHLQYYQFATRALTPFFQSDSRVLGWLRDRLFPTSRWIGPLRRRMVRTMTGIDRGIVRRPLPLADVLRLLGP